MLQQAVGNSGRSSLSYYTPGMRPYRLLPSTYHRRLKPSITPSYSTVCVFISVHVELLADRQQYVKIGQHLSTTRKLNSGAPQRSVLGPLIFTSYVSPVGNVITSMGLKHHQYADDKQLYFG